MTEQELVKQWLQPGAIVPVDANTTRILITSLRERLAQPEQEPVAHTLNCVCGAVWDISLNGAEEMVHTPDAPKPRREWVGLTDEELEAVDKTIDKFLPLSEGKRLYARAIEAKLKEKNT